MGESEPIIRVEGLGKKYVISHQQEGRGATSCCATR